MFFFRFSKKIGFGVFLVQQNMVKTTLPDGLETSGQKAFLIFVFWMIFSVFQKKWVLGYSLTTLLWYRCYYPHRSRDALFPVCGIFAVKWGKLRIYTNFKPPEVIFKSPTCDNWNECGRTYFVHKQYIAQYISCSLQEGKTFRIPHGGFGECKSGVCPFSQHNWV